MSKMKKQTTSWEPVASWYDELLQGEDTYQSQVILPNLMRLLPPQGRVIDIACGQGFFSRYYAEKGADVLGIDISRSLIEHAKKHENGHLQFAVAPAHKMPMAESAAFDGAMIVLA
ncbi:class I SAM-dependent methyltransferase, partial [Candidatus Parcubacteria bacterium]